MLKFLFAPLVFATAVFAQRADIGLPVNNQTVNPGSDLIVQVQVADTLTGSQQVALVVGLQSCPNSPCMSPSDFMGTILYNGPFDPEFHEGDKPPYQNFTVQVPSSVPTGTALIGVAHLALAGTGDYPLFEVLKQTITIA